MWEEVLRGREEREAQYLDARYRAEEAVRARVLSFPRTSVNGVGGVELLREIKSQIPKVIIRNKLIFEGIFTLLQSHPCYLIKWITKTNLHRQSKEVVNVLNSVYGKRELVNNPRL